jgi:hypothetical protein
MLRSGIDQLLWYVDLTAYFLTGKFPWVSANTSLGGIGRVASPVRIIYGLFPVLPYRLGFCTDFLSSWHRHQDYQCVAGV